MKNQIKQLIENYKTEIAELRNRISDSNETYNEGGYECETDYEYDQTRWGYQITALVRVVEDLAKL